MNDEAITVPAADLAERVRQGAAAIALRLGASGPGLVFHRPEEWAEASRCFENVAAKVRKDGGRIVLGWTLHLRHVAEMPGQSYLFITHHAVWHARDGSLVNVTPYPDPKHHPLPAPGEDILFFVDRNAKLVPTRNGVGPLPMQFFPLGDDKDLAAYVERLNGEEQEKCRKLYENIE